MTKHTGQLHHGQLTIEPLRFSGDKITMLVTFRTDVVMGKAAAAQITNTVLNAFKKQIEASGFSCNWPPELVEITPHADFKGLRGELMTRARQAGLPAIVLH